MEIGGAREQLAIGAFEKNQEIKYVHALLMVKSILAAGQQVAAALSEGQGPSLEGISTLLSTYKEMLMPSLVTAREEKVEKVKRIMEREAKAGPLRVESMVYETRKKRGFN